MVNAEAEMGEQTELDWAAWRVGWAEIDGGLDGAGGGYELREMR